MFSQRNTFLPKTHSDQKQVHNNLHVFGLRLRNMYSPKEIFHQKTHFHQKKNVFTKKHVFVNRKKHVITRKKLSLKKTCSQKKNFTKNLFLTKQNVFLSKKCFFLPKNMLIFIQELGTDCLGLVLICVIFISEKFILPFLVAIFCFVYAIISFSYYDQEG